MACFLAALFALSLASAPAEPAPQTAPTSAPALVPLAVMPVSTLEDDAAVRDAVAAFAPFLTARLAEAGGHAVISADDVSSLLAGEADRQSVGCADDGCLAEIAGALGARLVVLGQVSRLGDGLTWTSTLLDQREGTVVRRVVMKGRSAQALLAQAEEVAMALVGRESDARLEGPGAMKRLGFSRPGDLEAFKAYRARQADMTTQEALTAFVIDRNTESTRLALLEAVLFGAAVGVAPAMAVAWGASTYLTTFHHQFLLGMLATAPIFLLVPVSCSLGLAGVGVSVYDALDVGSVKVHRDGCCRDDVAISEEMEESPWTKALAIGTLLSGGMALGMAYMSTLPYVVVVVATLLYGVGYTPYDIPDYQGNPLVTPSSQCAVCSMWCCAGLPTLGCMANAVVGALLLLWPPKPFVTHEANPGRAVADADSPPAPVEEVTR
jgi:TolB-like protein